MSITYEALALFLALVGLYSPVAALSSYLPVVRPFGHAEQVRLAAGLTLNVAIFVLAAIWVGDPLLELLGISPAALTATGGIALILAAVPMMRGTQPDPAPQPAPPAPAAGTPSAQPAAPLPSTHAAGSPPGLAAEPSPSAHAAGTPSAHAAGTPSAHAAVPEPQLSASALPAPAAGREPGSPPVPPSAGRDPSDARPAAGIAYRKVLFTPLTFPLTVGGATFAIGAATSADVGDSSGRLLLSIAAVGYGLVTGLTVYAAGHVERRISVQAGQFLDRIAGILLTCIAVILLANGFTDLVLARAGHG
ncbi:MarC family protein [Paractinoplanes toevensis]|uniref:UPF0056 membrane protein n=1 Tax=Paractinoplanes toevensis TaxID=571911 RepID=A0A919TFJ9_9ACTN|nr:MarC family protein [Actinoplanes toevensis]GIM93101.1 hypothetical protein Ato02nite_048940 [Actinoplanes toevensis]